MPSKLSCSCDKNIVRCQDCSIARLCLPFMENDHLLAQLEKLLNRKKDIEKGSHLFYYGHDCSSLYAIRSGCFKSYMTDKNDNEQINGFYIAGDFVGFDALNSGKHQVNLQAINKAQVCEISLENFSALMCNSSHNMDMFIKLMSSELNYHQTMLFSLSQKTAEERLAKFLYTLSCRYEERGFSVHEFRMPMNRVDISSYLGITIETISRILTKLESMDIIFVKGKYIRINKRKDLFTLTGDD